MRKCIVYLPYKLEKDGKGARMLRPLKMMQAFRDIGYEVSVIQGYAKERKEQISQLKKMIRLGIQFDFMYSENHTEPTRLTDPHHLPMHPLLDFGFFRYVKSRGIPIGLFYCDIYWKFASYGEGLPNWKKKAALSNYKYDVRQYKKYLDHFYVPDMVMCDYIGESVLTSIASELPPGAENLTAAFRQYKDRNFETEPLQIFYVGGLGGQYQIVELVKAVAVLEHCELTICCRPAEWEKEKICFRDYLNDRIHIIHKNESDLEPYYRRADLCSLLFATGTYISFAKPFKTYEYLAHEIPVIATLETGGGRFVSEEDTGWAIDCSADVIARLLRKIMNRPQLLEEKRKSCIDAKKRNLWTCRARQVAEDLCGIRLQQMSKRGR